MAGMSGCRGVVQAYGAEICQSAQTGLPQAGSYPVVAGAGDLAGAPRICGRDPDGVAHLVGQGEEQCRLSLVLARTVRTVPIPGASGSTDGSAVEQDDDATFRATSVAPESDRGRSDRRLR